MLKRPRYITVKGYSIAELQKRIDQKSMQGYEPIGEMQIRPSDNYSRGEYMFIREMRPGLDIKNL